ncbi:MAG: transketolase, partial [Alphaproteobacteria bacterium]|nr:transketolase [Alphaproteobacteria bacterium]
RLPAELPAAMAEARAALAASPKPTATRRASGALLDAIAGILPELVSGSADLAGSNNTRAKVMPVLDRNRMDGRFINYGIREHGMAAAMNGMALHGGIVPASGTFLVFSDYCRPAIRLSALMGLRVIYVMTHDSIGVGEDGPTHQPVEHLAALRAIPNLHVLRPADAIEVAECWELALTRTQGPSLLVLSRQDLPLMRTGLDADNLSARGAYEIRPAEGRADVTLIATGSEVSLAEEARALLAGRGIAARILSMPCRQRFEAQDAAAREALLGSAPRIAIEAASPFGWASFLRPGDRFVGMTGFGASAPYKDLYTHFGLTPDRIAEEAASCLSGRPGTGSHSSRH